MQPLYLSGNQPVEIELEEGPSFAITRAGEATRLLPLSLVSHILASGDRIRWSQAALLACAQHDIPVYFSDIEHHLVAAMRANTDTPAQEWQRFMRLLEDPEGIDYYQQFLAGKKTQIQQDVSQRWTRQSDVRIPGYHRWARIIRSAVQADVDAELHRRGFRRRIPLLRQAGIHISRDFSKLLEPCVHWVINENWKRLYIGIPEHQLPSPPSRRQLIHGYEKQAEFIRDLIRALTVSFLYWLAESDSDYIIHRRRY